MKKALFPPKKSPAAPTRRDLFKNTTFINIFLYNGAAGEDFFFDMRGFSEQKKNQR